MTGPTDLQRAWVARVLGINATTTGGDPGGAVVRLAKGMLMWNQTRSSIGEQIRTLQQAILTQAAEEPDFDLIEENIGNLEVVLEMLDDRLTAKLNALRGTIDPAEKRKLSEEARAIVKEYQAYVTGDELIGDIDHNGFVPLTIKASATTALAEIVGMI